MKLVRIFSLLSLVIMASCSVDNSDDIQTAMSEVDENNVVKATIGTFDFESTSPNTFARLIGDDSLEISGSDGNARVILSFDGYTGNGLYTLDGDFQILAAQYVISAPGAPDRVWNAVSQSSSAGQATITTVTDEFVEGTYTFTASNDDEGELTFTGGTFKVQL